MNIKTKIVELLKTELQMFVVIPLLVLISSLYKIPPIKFVWFALFLIFVKIAFYIHTIIEKIQDTNKNTKYSFEKYIGLAIFRIFTINLSFSIDYLSFYIIDKKSFHGLTEGNNYFINLFELFYFSVVTFATIGYGDIYASSLPTRILVTVEIFTSFGLVIFVFSNYDKIKNLLSSSNQSHNNKAENPKDEIQP